MTTLTTTTIGRGYRYLPKSDPARFLAEAREDFAKRQGKAATYCAVHPAGVERFSGLWPGAVVEDRRVLKGEVMLGREE